MPRPIDVHQCLDLEGFRAAYARIADTKNLKKVPSPHVAGTPSTTMTLGIIYAHSVALPLERFAAEFELLTRAQMPSRQWPDMLAVGSVGAISYAAHFPGDAEMGDYLPPGKVRLPEFDATHLYSHGDDAFSRIHLQQNGRARYCPSSDLFSRR